MPELVSQEEAQNDLPDLLFKRGCACEEIKPANLNAVVALQSLISLA